MLGSILPALLDQMFHLFERAVRIARHQRACNDRGREREGEREEKQSREEISAFKLTGGEEKNGFHKKVLHVNLIFLPFAQKYVQHECPIHTKDCLLSHLDSRLTYS